MVMPDEITLLLPPSVKVPAVTFNPPPMLLLLELMTKVPLPVLASEPVPVIFKFSGDGALNGPPRSGSANSRRKFHVPEF